MTSNVGQNYPYRSETESDRAQALEAIFAAHDGLRERVAGEASPPDANENWWVWKCATKGCPGLLHVAGYARDLHAVYVVCDGACGRTFLR